MISSVTQSGETHRPQRHPFTIRWLDLAGRITREPATPPLSSSSRRGKAGTDPSFMTSRRERAQLNALARRRVPPGRRVSKQRVRHEARAPVGQGVAALQQQRLVRPREPPSQSRRSAEQCSVSARRGLHQFRLHLSRSSTHLAPASRDGDRGVVRQTRLFHCHLRILHAWKWTAAQWPALHWIAWTANSRRGRIGCSCSGSSTNWERRCGGPSIICAQIELAGVV